MDTILRVADLHKRFGSRLALDGLSLNVRQGEFLLLLGPNGAGKTTLLRAIVGRVKPDAGEITLFGEPLQLGARARIGLVPQEIALYPLLSARENLAVFGRLSGLERTRLAAKIDWALEWTGLRDRADEPIRGFSGGMKRRLNIAVGILHEPKLVLLDEPTEGVDPQSREKIWRMLTELQSSGAALVLTTHQLSEAEMHCNRIVIVDCGRAIADGTLTELVARTVGSGRRVTLTLDRIFPSPGPKIGDRNIEAAGLDVSLQIEDFARDLPALMAAVTEAGCKLEDIHIVKPTLQEVFLQLTGRELRE